MELAAVRFFLHSDLCVGELQIVEEVSEQLDALKRLIANTEDRTHYLALHLSVDKHNVFLVLDDVTDFVANFPDLCSQLVHDVIEQFVGVNIKLHLI